MDKLQEKKRIETLIRSLSRFSEKALLIVSGKSDVTVDAKKIGPVLIFERLWTETGIKEAIQNLLNDRKYQFNVERAIFLTVFNRLMVSGSHRTPSQGVCGKIFQAVGVAMPPTIIEV